MLSVTQQEVFCGSTVFFSDWKVTVVVRSFTSYMWSGPS